MRNVLLPDAAALVPTIRKDLLGGVVTLGASARSLAVGEDGNVEATDKPLTLIPYCTWANRGRGEMAVWLPNSEASARPTSLPTVSTRAMLSSSGDKNVPAINDGLEPGFMGDDSNPFFDWWPRKGTKEWVEMAFDAPTTVSETTLYWFDDTGRGECRVPAGRTLFYKDEDVWRPIEAATCGVLKDQPNRTVFTPVTTTALRLEVQQQTGWSSGLWEWRMR